jgi:hypothetical protein
MCGRFTLRKSAEEMAAYFHTHGIPTWARRYNIAPEQHVLTLFESVHGEREWVLRRWGLVPSWSKEPKVSFSNINARVEYVTKSPAFRGAFKNRRCLIPADGFYEWSGPKGHKVATLFHLKDDSLFVFAGLWEHWERDAEVLDTSANHHRGERHGQAHPRPHADHATGRELRALAEGGRAAGAGTVPRPVGRSEPAAVTTEDTGHHIPADPFHISKVTDSL